jgi:hypothetical protein
MVFSHGFKNHQWYFTHGMLKSELKIKRGKINYYLIKVVTFQMNMTFHVRLMVKYKWRRGL